MPKMPRCSAHTLQGRVCKKSGVSPYEGKKQCSVHYTQLTRSAQANWEDDWDKEQAELTREISANPNGGTFRVKQLDGWTANALGFRITTLDIQYDAGAITWKPKDLGPIPKQKEVLRKHLCYTPEGELDMTGADWDWLAQAKEAFPKREYSREGNKLIWKLAPELKTHMQQLELEFDLTTKDEGIWYWPADLGDWDPAKQIEMHSASYDHKVIRADPDTRAIRWILNNEIYRKLRDEEQGEAEFCDIAERDREFDRIEPFFHDRLFVVNGSRLAWCSLPNLDDQIRNIVQMADDASEGQSESAEDYSKFREQILSCLETYPTLLSLDFTMDGNVISWKKTDPDTEKAIQEMKTWGGLHFAGSLEQTQAVVEKLRRKFPYREFPVQCYINLGQTHSAHCMEECCN